MSSVRGRVVPKVTCDICGREREALPGVFSTVERRRVCNWHPHFMPVEKLDGQPYLTFQARPIKDSRPFDPRPSYQLGEEQAFSFLRDGYPFYRFRLDSSQPSPGCAEKISPIITPVVPITASAYSAAWAGIYFHSVVAEAKRPYGMVAGAKAALATIADWLVANQEAGPGVFAGTGHLENGAIPNANTQPQWGGYRADVAFQATATSPQYFTLSSAAAGIALLRAFQVFGKQIYADAARACAWFVRNSQCTDLAAFAPATSDAAGTTPKHWGAWCDAFQLSGSPATWYEYTNTFRVQTLLCLRFLSLYQSVMGDETIGSPSTATVTLPSGALVAFMTASRAQLVSVCLAEGRAFWETAQPDVTLGRPIKGLSIETPAQGFSSFHAAALLAAGTGSWGWGATLSASGTTINSDNWATGLWALYEVDGFSATVVTLFDWLMSFSSNPAVELPAKYDDQYVLSHSFVGTYNPKFALADVLQVKSASQAFDLTQNSSTGLGYFLGSAGLLAPLYSTRQQASFKDFKDALDLPRRISMQSGRTLYLGTLGSCGYAFQCRNTLFGGVAGVGAYVARSAQAALAYRQAPSSYLGRGKVQ